MCGSPPSPPPPPPLPPTPPPPPTPKAAPPAPDPIGTDVNPKAMDAKSKKSKGAQSQGTGQLKIPLDTSVQTGGASSGGVQY